MELRAACAIRQAMPFPLDYYGSAADMLSHRELYAEYPDNDEAAAAYGVDSGDVETVFGWFARLSALGYLDCTEWSGPYDTEEEARRECRDMYDLDPSTEDTDATEAIANWLDGSDE